MKDKIDINLMVKSTINLKKIYDIKVWFDEWFFPFDIECSDDMLDINVEKTYLYHAVETGNSGVIGINLERTALNLAIINENIEIVKLLLAHDSIDINLSDYDTHYANDPDDGGNRLRKPTPLIYALEKDNVEIVKILLMNNKIDVNAKFHIADMLSNDRDNYYEFTPLYVAIKHENIDIINLLLMNEKLDLNSTSIDYTSYGNEEEFTKAYEPPYTERFRVDFEEKNIDLLKKFLLEKNIDLNPQIKEKCGLGEVT